MLIGNLCRNLLGPRWVLPGLQQRVSQSYRPLPYSRCSEISTHPANPDRHAVKSKLEKNNAGENNCRDRGSHCFCICLLIRVNQQTRIHWR